MSDVTYNERLIEQYKTEIYELEEELNKITFDPQYDGIIVLKYIKCGKKGCKCSLDLEHRILHGPYPHFQYRVGKVLHQKYLNRKNVKEYKEKVDNNIKYKQLKKEIRIRKAKIKEIEKTIKED